MQMETAQDMKALLMSWKNNEMEIMLMPENWQERLQDIYKEQMKRIRNESK